MPIYGFKCKSETCGVEFESLVHSFKEANETPPKCPTCGSEQVERDQVAKRTSFQLKGTGWTGKINKKYHT